MRRAQQGKGTLQPLAPLVAQTLQQAGLGRVALLGSLAQRWQEIVGPHLAAVTHPENIRSRVLFVTVTEAIWLQQLMFYQSQLLQNMRRVLGDVPVNKLHFVLAVTARQAAPPQPAPAMEPLSLTAAEERQVLEETNGIADPELRELVRRTWRKGWQVGRWSP
jgi:predicted nucleic acid-binding Zn ribbon protein